MPEPIATPAEHSWMPRYGWPLLVAVAAVLMAGQLFAWAWQAGDASWWWMTHDRHTHYVAGLNLAHDLRTLDLPRLRHDLDALRVWGPLHALLQGGVQLLFGPDHRLALLPSLAAWVGMLILAFLLTRRMVAEHGTAAGVAVVGVLAALPAYRAYAVDVMLESLGIMLTLLVLYCYVAVRQERTVRWGQALAVSLLLLFFHKYNYWLIVVIGLCLAEFFRQPRTWLTLARQQRSNLIELLRYEARQPLTWIAAVVFLLACVVWLRRGFELTMGSWHLNVHEPHTLFSVAFIAFFIQLVRWWRREGRGLSERLDPTVRPVLVWHGWATAVWFLIPKRLGYFFWFLSPANSTQEFKSTTLVDGFWFYLKVIEEDYCCWSWQLVVLLALLPIALGAARRLQSGSLAVFLVFAVGAFLTMQHAMTKNRHAHTWAALGWLLALVGVYAFLPRGRRWASWAASSLALLILAVHFPGYLVPGHAEESGTRADRANPLEITRAYLPALQEAKHSTMVCNVSAKFLFSWTYLETFQRANFSPEIKRFREELQHDAAALHRWLRATPSDALVVVEVLPHSPHAGELVLEPADLTILLQVLKEQRRFVQTDYRYLSDGVAITVWKRFDDQPKLLLGSRTKEIGND